MKKFAVTFLSLVTICLSAQAASAASYNCSNSKGDSATIFVAPAANELNITSSSISARPFVCSVTTMRGSNKVNCTAWQNGAPMVDQKQNMVIEAVADVSLFDGSSSSGKIDFDTLSESLSCTRN